MQARVIRFGFAQSIFTALILSYLSPSIAQQCQIWDASYLSKKLIIGQIDVVVGNIFELEREGENRKLHNTANSWHIPSKDIIVKRELLFRSGDVFNLQVIKESERILRSKSFIKDAEIYPVSVCGKRVTIKVETKDNWSLTPGISAGSIGGKSKYLIELQEKNLFGYGKSLEFKYRKGIEREQKSISYRDSNLFGSKKRLRLGYQNNSDGDLVLFKLAKPYVSLNAKKSWQVSFLDQELINPIYDTGEIVDEIGQFNMIFTLGYGKLLKRSPSDVHRLEVGLTRERNRFFNSQLYPLTLISEPREFDYPWVAYEYFQERYIERRNFNSMGRQEDISLGHHFSAKLGASINESSVHYDVRYRKGLFSDEHNLLQLNSYFNGIYQSSSLINSHLGIKLDWYKFQSSKRTFFFSLTADKADNLFSENRQYLGGESGLRGYPFRYVFGENKFLATLEQRYFYNWYPLKIFQFGSALFIDAGSIWNQNTQKKILSNIGFGMRLVPTRTSGGQVIHFDIAFPLVDRNFVDSYQLQITAKRSF